jgi:hypothetical protein
MVLTSAESSAGDKGDRVMLKFLKRAGIVAAAVGAMALATTAEARDRYGHRGNDDASLAIGAGIIGLAIGAAIASDHDRGYYYDRGYYGYPRGYYYRAYPRRYYRAYPRGDYYYDRYPRRHYRDYRGYGWRGGW